MQSKRIELNCNSFVVFFFYFVVCFFLLHFAQYLPKIAAKVAHKN